MTRPPSRTELANLMAGSRLPVERYGQRLTKMRKAALESFEPEDVVEALVNLRKYGMVQLKKGNHKPICEWLDRIGITAASYDMEDRLGALKTMLEEVAARRQVSPQSPPVPPEIPPLLEIEAKVEDG
jgi:hypothetical protein